MTEPRTEAELENDIRELRGAEPAELARRLVERGWTKAAAGPRDEGLRETVTEYLRLLDEEQTLDWDTLYWVSKEVQQDIEAALARMRAALAKASE